VECWVDLDFVYIVPKFEGVDLDIVAATTMSYDIQWVVNGSVN
jgi:hypothetical protein